MSKRLGIGWEVTILAQARKAGVWIIKTKPKMVASKGRVKHVEKGPLDFLAVLNGRPMHFDAKETSKDTWNAKSECKTHQRDKMMRAGMVGMASGIFLRMPQGRYLLTSGAIQRLVEGGKAFRPEMVMPASGDGGSLLGGTWYAGVWSVPDNANIFQCLEFQAWLNSNDEAKVK